MSDNTPEFDTCGIGFTDNMTNRTLHKYTRYTFEVPLGPGNLHAHIVKIGKDSVRPLLKELNIRAYHELPQGVVAFCKATIVKTESYKGAGFWKRNFEETQTDFTNTINDLYKQALHDMHGENHNSHKREVLRSSFIRMIRFQVNDHLSDCCLTVLKALCKEKKQNYVPAIRYLMGKLYKDTLPMDSLKNFWSNIDMYFVTALKKLHNHFYPAKEKQSGGYAKLAMVFAYEHYRNVDNWTQKIFRDAYKNAAAGNKAARDYARLYKSKLKAKVNQALKDAYNLSKHKSAMQSLNLPGQDFHQDFLHWCDQNNQDVCGDSFVKFQVMEGNPVPWWWHCIPLPSRFMYKKMLHKILTVYPGDELPASILRMIVHHNKRNGDEWSIHTWWNVFVEGCLRHVNNQKGQHLQKGQDFILVGMSPDNDDWHRLTQDLYNQMIPPIESIIGKLLDESLGKLLTCLVFEMGVMSINVWGCIH